jgi:hypothetical protein
LFKELAEVYMVMGESKEILNPGPSMLLSESERRLPPGEWVMGKLKRR